MAILPTTLSNSEEEHTQCMTSTYHRPRMDQGSATTHRLHSTRPQSLGSKRSDLTAVMPRTDDHAIIYGQFLYVTRASHRPYLYPFHSPHVHASPVPCTLMNGADL